MVSVPALLTAQAQVKQNIAPEHQQFLACLPRDRYYEIVPEIHDIPAFTQTVLGWEAADLIPFPTDTPLSEELASLEVALPEYNETLRPTFAVKEFDSKEGQSP